MEKTLIRDQAAWQAFVWKVRCEHADDFLPQYGPSEFPCVVFGMLDYQDGKWPYVYEFAYLTDFA